MKIWLLWYTSPEQSEPDEPQLEGVFLEEENAHRAATSHWHRVEERDVTDAPKEGA